MGNSQKSVMFFLAWNELKHYSAFQLCLDKVSYQNYYLFFRQATFSLLFMAVCYNLHNEM